MRAEESNETADNPFAGNGDTNVLLRSHDWSQTPLGAIETWSESLKTAVQSRLAELNQAQRPEQMQQVSVPPQNCTQIATLGQADQADAFRVTLSDALRLLTDANEIQATAARILGESLGASRVIYVEVLPGGHEVIVHKNYTNHVAELSGRYRLEDFGRNLTDDHRAGQTAIVPDVANSLKYTDSEKAMYRNIDIAAHIDVPLIKNNQFVALLAVHQSTPRQWTEVEVKQVEETAERTWAAVERAHAEAALRESEAKYRMLFESIDEGYFIADVIFDADDCPIDVFYLEANPAVKRITGLDLAGRSLRELDPNYESAWWEAYGRVVQTGIAERQELYTEPLDSWFSFYTFKIGDEDSRRVGCVFQDITQRKRTEQALRDSEQRYRTLFDSIDEAFCVCELMVDETGEPYDYRVLEVNPAFEIMTGLQQVTGKAASELIPTLEPFWLETYARVVRMGESTRFESYLQGLDGWFDVYVAPLNVFHSQQFAVLFRNITQQKRASLKAELLATVRDDLAEITEVGDIVQMVGDRLHRYLNISSCAFVEINEQADEAAIHHHWHQSHVPNLVGVYALPQFVAEAFLHTAQAGQPVVVRNVAADPRIVDSGKYAALSIGAELNIPLIRDDEWKFSLTVFHPVPYNWRDDEIALMQELASRIWTKLERARAEAALRDSRAELERQVQKFDATLSTITDCVFRFDRDGRFLYANQVLLDLLGLSATEAIGKTMAELNYPEAVERQLLNDMRQVFETGETVRSETAYTSPAGAGSYFENLLSPVLAADGTVESVVGSSRNISDRKRVEIALRENEERFRTLADNMSQFAWMADETGWIFWYNQRWFDYTGTTLEEMQGWGWQQVHHPEHVDRVVEHFRHCLETGEGWEDTFPLRSKDGTYRWFLSRAVPIRDEQGRILRWFGTNTDISDRKQAEAALQESEELKRRILESSQDCIKVLTLEGRLLYINTGGLNLLELDDPASVLNAQWLDFWQDDDRLSAEAVLAAAQAGNAAQLQGCCPTAKGNLKWWDVIVTPIRDASGVVAQLLAISRDITKQKQAESEREQLLKREQLAREEAERANRIKDEFLAVLSHELRSPLNPILGWARLLRNGSLPPARQMDALATIERNAKLQSQLIEDLLDISRIMQGKLTLTATWVSLAFVIAAAVETVRLAADAKTIQTTLDLDPDVAPVSGDAARLQQVVWNLLTNAVKFTPNGGQVTVELRQIEQSAQIRVIDTGKGINPNFLPHVFEYFRQEDGSTTRTFGGLGLGLAIVRQIVELHGGTVRAESAGEHQGATFIVQLPVIPQPLSIIPQLSHTQAKTKAPLDNIYVLLVDDDTDTREFQAFLLEQNGAKVTAVDSGLAALKVLEQSKPDVVVSDVGMPHMDGYMLMQQLRALPPEQGGQTPAIALTAYVGELNHQQALQAGFQQHLAKPIEPVQLIKAITTLVGKK